MKYLRAAAALCLLVFMLTACAKVPVPSEKDKTQIRLSDDVILVNGKKAQTDSTADIYVAEDIVYYEQGKDFTYGEGSESDAHSAEEAAAHKVVHITKAGTYSLSGELSKGQIAIDLGKDAKENPEAVVTLILDGADITCSVAPAIIFYNVYECGVADEETAQKDVDTTKAGANVIIADGTTNTVNGSYVARIYEPGTVVLSEDGKEVEDADKLHKYDGAFYSKMSMNICGEEKEDGVLNINAENEGLDSELHLTINGGYINIRSGNDGINTNEDNVSVTAINGGYLNIIVTGETGEGDGIDSNGWLVFNGGTTVTSACSKSADAGIDSDKGIHINGGTVISSGHMLDRIEDGAQNYAVLTFDKTQSGKNSLQLKNDKDEEVFTTVPENDYSVFIYSAPTLTAGEYTLWCDGVRCEGFSSGMMQGQGMKPEGMEMPEGMEPPEDFERPEKPQGERPEWPEGEKPQMPEGMESPEGFERPELPEGEFPEHAEGERSDMNMRPGNMGEAMGEVTDILTLADKGNMFRVITQ